MPMVGQSEEPVVNVQAQLVENTFQIWFASLISVGWRRGRPLNLAGSGRKCRDVEVG